MLCSDVSRMLLMKDVTRYEVPPKKVHSMTFSQAAGAAILKRFFLKAEQRRRIFTKADRDSVQ